MAKYKQQKKCKMCNSTNIPYKRWNDYCKDHLPDDMRCTQITRQDRRCKNVVMRNSILCTVHNYVRKLGKRRIAKIEKQKLPGGRGPGLIYIVWLGRENYYKIGQTVDMSKRLANLRSSNPWIEQIDCQAVFNTSKIEKDLHHMFKDQQLEREIFLMTDEDLSQAKDYLQQNKYNGKLI